MKYRKFKAFGAAIVVSYLFEWKGQEHSLYTVKFPHQECVEELSLLYTISFSAAVG